ncbi:hypothetical protein CBR_g20044 [Chara braunii]|uniref:Uncharacterized protein n=1 Tax=Chara braunii TaxID=69332 RepID=A0A388KZB8_CHABU|nr:hypothetical protein CBR_g20044 [Chara braunii]|eukprot:GBG75414.1 hypothetical protein CBR_g20044 [Chara braunii]
MAQRWNALQISDSDSDGSDGTAIAIAQRWRTGGERWRNDGATVESNGVQLLIDLRKVCEIPAWERYYNHRSLSRETVDNIKGTMSSQFREKKIWTKNPPVLAPIYKPVSRRPEKADTAHKDVFKPEDKDKYYSYPVNGQHTVTAVKDLEGEPIFNLWKMHSWPARVVWFSDRDFAGYRQVSLNENTRHKMSKQRLQKAAFLDIWEAWENEGRPVAIQGNPSSKEAEKQKFFDFQKLILGKSPNGAHWTLAQKDSSLADKEYVSAVCNALRQWMPLVTAGDDVFRKTMKFYAKWAEGKLLGCDGKTPLSRPGKYMSDKSPGLQAIPKTGSKGAAGETKIRWLVRVPPPPTKKKTQVDNKFFVVVKEPDMFCWQCLADMTDAEKLSILDDILALRGVFVQSAGGHLKRRHKPGIKDMVATRKVDCVMLRMFHYILFLETKEDKCVWCHGSLFFRTEGKLLKEYGLQGLTKQVWVEMRKHFQGAVEYVNTCKRTLPHEKESLDDAKKLYDDDRFPKSFEKSVRSILRRKEEEVRDTIRVSGDVRHIKWPDLNRVTSLIPFAFPPSQAHSHVTAIHEVVRHYVCNLYVLDLCDPILLTNWREDDFANLQGPLQTLSPTHWVFLIFFPSCWELSFLKGMVRLSVHHVRTRKWVCNAQKQATVREGNMLVEECDRLYVIFNAEKLEDNTFAVYPASSPTKASRAHGPSPAKHTVAGPSGQVVACFDVAEEERFSRSMWEDSGVTSSQGPAHGEMGRNPSRLLGLLVNFCKVGQTVFFFGKAHAYRSERRRVGEGGEDDRLPSRRNLVFTVLNEYTGPPRESVSHFLRRLEHVYFTLAEPLTLENYKSQFDDEDPFDADDMEELSDPETFDFESMPLPRVVGKVGDKEEGGPRRYSTSPAGLKRVFRGEPVDDQLFDDGEDERDYDHEPCDRLPVDHDTWQNDRLYFFGKHHRFTLEDVWGHNVVWHPRIFQPAVRNGIWVMAIKEADGKWSGLKRQGAGAFKRKAITALVEHLSLMNPERNDQDVDAYAEQKLHELYANNMLEFRAPFYALETAPSRGIDWRMPQPPPVGHHPGGGGGGDEGDGGGGGGDGSQFAGKGTGETSSVEKASGGKRSDGKGSGGKGSGGKGSGGKRRTSGSPQYMEADPHCVGSRDSDMRDEATRTFDQVRVDSHLSARSLFPLGQESPSRRAQQRSPVLSTLLLKEGASSFCLEGGMPALRRSEGATSGSLGSGDRHKLRIHSDLLPSPYAISAPHATWLHTRALVIGTSEEVLHSCSTVATMREGVVKGGKWTSVQSPVLGDDEDEEEPAVEARVHGDEKGGEPVVEGREVNVDIRTDPQRKDGDSSPTRCGEEQGGQASVLSTAQGIVLHEATELGDDSAATELVSDSGVTEMQNVESSVEGGEVAVSMKMDPERKDHDSPSTRCSAEQGDRASVLSTGREMVLHEAIDLPSDSTATDLVSDTAVAEAQNLESSVDVGAVARQEGEFPQRAPEHGVRLLISLPMKPLKAVREKRLSGRSLAASPKKSSSVGLFKRVQMPRLFQRAVKVLKACGIDKEEDLRKHLAASIESVTALYDGSDDDGKRGVLKDPCPKYIAKDTFNKRGYNFSGKRADSS